MKKFGITLLAIILNASCTTKRDAILKRISREQYEQLMSFSYQEFDQTLDGGWRQFHEDPELQILLISDYIERKHAEEQSLRWHLGQLHGMINDYQNAIKYFQTCFFDEVADNPRRKAWNYYVHGTIAFMNNDEAKLNAYIDSLQNNDETMNIEVLMRLKENFGKPYQDAY